MDKKKILGIIAAVVAVAVIIAVICVAFNSCSDNEPADASSDISASDIDDTSSNSSSDETDSSEGTSSEEKTDNTDDNYVRPQYSKGDYTPVSAENTVDLVKGADYDAKITTFNVGGFYHGVDSGMHGDGQFAEWVPQNFREWLADMAAFDSDIYALQEFCPLFYENATLGQKLMAKDAFADVFKTLEMWQGSTANGAQPMYMGLAALNGSDYNISNISYGYLSEKSDAHRRAYMKGYVNIKGAKVAVYSVHLGFNDKTVVKDSWNEIINLMKQEDYCIVMGDMNSSAEISDFMLNAGMNVANNAEFGSFNTYEYNETQYIDNIFTTPNIELVKVECEKNKAGGSDHYPLSAWIKINTDMGSIKDSTPFETDSDGFIDGWYKP